MTITTIFNKETTTMRAFFRDGAGPRRVKPFTVRDIDPARGNMELDWPRGLAPTGAATGVKPTTTGNMGNVEPSTKASTNREYEGQMRTDQGGDDMWEQVLQRLDAIEQALVILAQGDDEGDGPDPDDLEAGLSAQQAATPIEDRRMVRRRTRDAGAGQSIAAINRANRVRYGLS